MTTSLNNQHQDELEIVWTYDELFSREVVPLDRLARGVEEDREMEGFMASFCEERTLVPVPFDTDEIEVDDDMIEWVETLAPVRKKRLTPASLEWVREPSPLYTAWESDTVITVSPFPERNLRLWYRLAIASAAVAVACLGVIIRVLSNHSGKLV